MYKLEPVSHLPEGYCAWDYFEVDNAHDMTFDTVEDAEAWLSANHLGPDEEGVSAEFEVVSV